MTRLFVLIAASLTPIVPLFATTPSGARNSTSPARSAALLYRKFCSSCHGADGRADTSRGKVNHARNLADPEWQDDVSDERIFNSIMNGRNVRGNMPGFSKRITEEETESLVTLVRGLRK